MAATAIEAPDEVIRYHEAGHAIACLSLSVPILWIDCYVKDGMAHGEVMHEPASPDAKPVVALAGMVAEALQFGESTSGVAHDGGQVAHLSHKEQQQAANRACAILRNNWPSVVKLADALKDRPTLRGEEIYG
jgi:ATP-dependent Zn protease